MPRTLQDAVADANRQGLAIHNLFQQPDGSWRATIRVFGATTDLVQNPVYLNYADGDDPAACIDRAIASSDKIPWRKAAASALEAMENGLCVHTLDVEDRPRVAARTAAIRNQPLSGPAGSSVNLPRQEAKPARESGGPKPARRDVLAETEAMLRDQASKSVAASKRRTLDDKLDSLL